MWTCPKCKESLEDQFDSCWKCAGEAAQGNAKPWVWRCFIGLLLVLQLAFVFHVSFRPANLAKVPYRQTERGAALAALVKNPSSENKAVLQEEQRLARRYVFQRQLRTAVGWLTMLFGIEVFLFCFLKNLNRSLLSR